MPWIDADVRSSIVDIFIENGIDLSTPLLSKSARDVEIKKKNQTLTDQIVIIQSDDIRHISDIGSFYSDKLNSIYINSMLELLEAGKTREGRNELAEKTGISVNLILKWVNLADLSRIEGVDVEYAELLESAGVDTVIDLSRRNPSNLYQKLVQENDASNIVKNTPTHEMVKMWVEKAKTLPREISY
ncbi:DUF4332 domain-containing protein [Candidatus Bathyarchaeota archaeon]|nr:MAG: DUF4332 domain-containing protein [Candidatus Bathyarchaeota archaeon]